MSSQGHINFKKKGIKNTFNNRISMRNILIVIALCFFYVIGKHYQSTNKPFAGNSTKIRHIKQTNSIY